MADDEDQIARRAYNEIAATTTMRNLPRFGRSTNFADLWGTKEEQGDYIVGLLFGGLLLFSLFFAWSIALAIFKCLGQKRVGFLSGASFVRPPSTTTTTTTTTTVMRPFISRLVFLNASLLFILFSVLFVTQGLTNLRTTITTVVESSNNVNAVMADFNLILSDVKQVGSNVTKVRDTFFNRLASGGKQCLENDVLEQETNRDYSELINTIREALAGLGNGEPDNLEAWQNSTEYIQESAAAVNDDVENVDIGDWQSLIIIIPYIIIPSVLLVGVCAAWFEIDIPYLRCVLSWLILPIFVLQVIFAYALSSGILIAASANGDFCSGGESKTPDGTVNDILVKLGYSRDDLVVAIINWYIGQCTSNNPFEVLKSYQGDVEGVKLEITEWTLALEEAGNAALSDLCQSDVELLSDLSRILNDNLQRLVVDMKAGLYLLRCSNIVRLYTNPVYDGTCTYSITGVTWAFAAFAVVGCMGLIMIMLRSAWQLDVYYQNDNHITTTPPDDYEDPKQIMDSDDNNNQDEYGGYTGYDEQNNGNFASFDNKAKDIGEPDVAHQEAPEHEFIDELLDQVIAEEHDDHPEVYLSSSRHDSTRSGEQ